MNKSKSDRCCFFKSKAPPAEKTRDLILEAAKKHFCEKGFEGSSVRDICDEVGANVSAIKYYFGGKEGLYRECILRFGEDRLSMATQILTKADSFEDFKLRLKIFAADFIQKALADMHTTKMVCHEIENQSPLIQDIFQSTFLKVHQMFAELFEDAQEKGFIRKDMDIFMASSFFFHAMINSLRMDHVAQKYFQRTLKDPQYQETYINNLISILLNGIKNQEP